MDTRAFCGDKEKASLTAFLTRLTATLPAPPSAVLAISAHWEAPVPTVSTHPRPPLLFDYHGFPPETYRLTWPAPGDPALAARVRHLLAVSGVPSAADGSRGFDHGTFVPLKLSFPRGEVPVVQLSLHASLDPVFHLALGRCLQPLRDDGVLIVGSGMSFHDLRAFFAPLPAAERAALAQPFDRWLGETVVLPAPQRNQRLERWATAPGARTAHPREEHLLPLHVVAGAAGPDPGRISWRGTFGGFPLSAVAFA
jgi:aromatic ring-opening dioxygenase catalytic subunit (LigB family)